jgi:hypothetical protein
MLVLPIASLGLSSWSYGQYIDFCLKKGPGGSKIPLMPGIVRLGIRLELPLQMWLPSGTGLMFSGVVFFFIGCYIQIFIFSS